MMTLAQMQKINDKHQANVFNLDIPHFKDIAEYEEYLYEESKKENEGYGWAFSVNDLTLRCYFYIEENFNVSNLSESKKDESAMIVIKKLKEEQKEFMKTQEEKEKAACTAVNI